MSEAHKELTRRWFEEVWNKQNEEAIDLMFAANGKAYGFPEANSVLVGPENFKKIHRFFCGAFPDIRVTVHDIVSEDDRVAVRWSASMTHLGSELGFAPTMKRETLEGSSFMTIANGQIVDGRNYMEMSALIQRLKAETETEDSEAQTSVA